MKAVFVFITLRGENHQRDENKETEKEKTCDGADESDGHGFLPFRKKERLPDFTTDEADFEAL